MRLASFRLSQPLTLVMLMTCMDSLRAWELTRGVEIKSGL